MKIISIFWGMRYLDFSTPKSVLISIYFDAFISVRSVWVGVGEMEVGILIVLLSAGEGECENSIRWDIMQV